MNWIEVIISFVVGGGLVAVFTIPQKIRAERLANDETVATQWKEWAEKLEVKNDEKDKKINSLYSEIRVLREEDNALSVDNAKLELLKCEKIGCATRMPPLGNITRKKREKKDENGDKK